MPLFYQLPRPKCHSSAIRPPFGRSPTADRWVGNQTDVRVRSQLPSPAFRIANDAVAMIAPVRGCSVAPCGKSGFRVRLFSGCISYNHEHAVRNDMRDTISPVRRQATFTTLAVDGTKP